MKRCTRRRSEQAAELRSADSREPALSLSKGRLSPHGCPHMRGVKICKTFAPVLTCCGTSVDADLVALYYCICVPVPA